MIDPATANPDPNDIMRNVIGELTETAATASGPSFPTQNASIN